MKHSIILDIFLDSFDHPSDVSLGNPLSPAKICSQIREIHRWSVSEWRAEQFANQVQNVLNQRFRGSGDVLLSDEFRDVHPKRFFRMVFSIISKKNLTEVDSSSSFTPVEVHHISKMYEFLQTEDGKQILHDGILSMMDLSFPWIDEQDIDDICNAPNIAHRETVTALWNKITRVHERVQSVVDAWKYVDEYTLLMKQVLVRYHTDEMEFAHENLKQSLGHPAWLRQYSSTFQASYERHAQAVAHLGMDITIVSYT